MLRDPLMHMTTRVQDQPSSDYHDYVIKDGQFIGAFEQMYQHCEDPWHQSRLESYAYESMLIELRQRRAGWRRLLDLGCGLGGFTTRMQEAAGCPVVGLDISPTAVRKGQAAAGARAVSFVAADAGRLPFRQGAFDGVISSELLWYVLPSIEQMLREIAGILRDGGDFWVTQHFYQPGEQRYGRDVMSGPEDCLALIRRAGFRITRTLDVDRFADHKLVIFAQKERAA